MDPRMNKQLYTLISSYEPVNAQEQQDQIVMLEYIKLFDNILTRDNHFGHFSSSPWIVNHDFTKVLMIYHNIYDSWGWCGGHNDGDDDFKHVAIKEGIEETGLSSLTLLSEAPIAIDILPVPPHMKRGSFISAHVHLNLTYLCMADETEELRIKPDENSGVKWVELSQINDMVTEEDMKIVYAKLIEASKKFQMHV